MVHLQVRDVNKYITKCIRGLVGERQKTFPRWKRGTCLECPPIDVGEDEGAVFSYHQDVSKNPHVMKLKRT